MPLKTTAELREIERRRKEAKGPPHPSVKLMRELGTVQGGRASFRVQLERFNRIARRDDFWATLMSCDLDRRIMILNVYAKSWAKLALKAWEEEKPIK